MFKFRITKVVPNKDKILLRNSQHWIVLLFTYFGGHESIGSIGNLQWINLFLHKRRILLVFSFQKFIWRGSQSAAHVGNFMPNINCQLSTSARFCFCFHFHFLIIFHNWDFFTFNSNRTKKRWISQEFYSAPLFE